MAPPHLLHRQGPHTLYPAPEPRLSPTYGGVSRAASDLSGGVSRDPSDEAEGGSMKALYNSGIPSLPKASHESKCRSRLGKEKSSVNVTNNLEPLNDNVTLGYDGVTSNLTLTGQVKG